MVVFLIREPKGLLRVAARTLLYTAFIAELDRTLFLIKCTTLPGILKTLSSCGSIGFWLAFSSELHDSHIFQCSLKGGGGKVG
jgi:hypothetical protein